MGTLAVNVLQSALLLVVVWTFATRARQLLFRGRLERVLFVSALREGLNAGQHGLARRIAEACAPAWPARIALAGLDALDAGSDVQARIEEPRLELLHAATSGIATLRALARMAPPLAFIGVILEAGKALGGGYGLAALQRGLPVRLALERGLLTFALGLATTFVAVTAVRVLHRGAAEQARAITEVSAALETAAQGPRSCPDVGVAQGASRWT